MSSEIDKSAKFATPKKRSQDMSPAWTQQIAAQSLTRGEMLHIEALVLDLKGGLRSILREELVGIYLYGSLVCGDFEFDISDIDLAVALREELDEARFTALDNFHAEILRQYPAWENRLELAYISVSGLRSFRRQSSAIGIISPGEPFHIIRAGEDWLISWYALRETGIALHGPPIAALIDPIPAAAWLKAVDEHIRHYLESVKKPHNKQALSYIVLTVARGLYTLEHERDASKVLAASWLAASSPQWADLIERALRYRRDPTVDGLNAEGLRSQVEAYLLDVLP